MSTSRSPFGWDLPPGVTLADIDPVGADEDDEEGRDEMTTGRSLGLDVRTISDEWEQAIRDLERAIEDAANARRNLDACEQHIAAIEAAAWHGIEGKNVTERETAHRSKLDTHPQWIHLQSQRRELEYQTKVGDGRASVARHKCERYKALTATLAVR